jgi:fructose-bisphosphate aldolase class II
MLVSSKFMLQKARKGCYAVGAFNINNLEILQAVIQAATEERSPVIVQTSQGAIQYAGLPYLYALVRVATEAIIPVAFHLDHGTDERFVKKMIAERRHTSIMFDGSRFPLKTNIQKTRAVVRAAHKNRLPVEAELGAIAGAEDTLTVQEREAAFTQPEEAEIFVKKTGCDFLAVSIGTKHGAYKSSGPAHLDFKRLRAISARVSIPLVLHGASELPAWLLRRAISAGALVEGAQGIPAGEIQEAIKLGIAKINVDTDLRLAFTTAVRQELLKDPINIDPRVFLGAARDLMTKVVREKIRLFGSQNKK